ncbi:sensor histidine kinase [Cohnella massiliensis]|uniref:sensor histidine kinase n=1 Tax=Cohnella massiliensis TaxID=1816691 RepID=UPI0009B97027|nr:HAMP domain-containing sensor histidine kinase [Cohnella massiliensis]
MKLTNKIHLYSSLLFTVLLVVMNATIYHVFSRLSIDSEIRQAETEAAASANGILQSIGTIGLPDLLRAYVPANGMLQVVTGPGESYAPVTSPSQSALSKRESSYFPQKTTDMFEHGGERYALVSVPVIWTDGSVANVQITQSLQETTDNLRTLRLVLIVVTAIALVPVVASSRLLGRLIALPIRSMTGTMRDIRRSGRFKRLELDTSSKDELTEMGQTFNRMIDLLESNFEKQEQFVSNASHELKTPLTVIESYASLLKRKGMERPDLFAESIEAIHSEAIRMRELTERLLLLARNKEQWNAKAVRLDLAELAAATVGAFRNAYRRDVHLEGAEEPIFVRTDEHLLKQLMFIFLDNARKYSEEPIAVAIGASGETPSAWIRIADRGVGIPKQDLSKVFDRFYRVDTARSRQTGGFGLGLSLAKEIAEAIGAELAMDSLEGVGTTVTISLPDRP